MILPSLAIVVPCHNEEEGLPDSVARLDELVARWLGKNISSCQYVLVNNGSTDGTLAMMRGLRSPVSDIVIVDLRRNFGYQGSISAGLHHSDADAVITIDADLQDDPAKIEEMLRLFDEGYELVLGVRQDRSSDSWIKRWFSQSYYRLLRILGVNAVPNHGDFRLMSRALVEDFRALGESNRFLRALILQLDSRYACVYYPRKARQRGKTKFTPGHLLSLAIDGITSFSSVPIRLVTLMGFLTWALSLAGFAVVLYLRVFTVYEVPGWASIISIFLFFSGIQMLSIGVLGEYMAKTYMETKRRPVFSVRKTYRQVATGNHAAAAESLEA